MKFVDEASITVHAGDGGDGGSVYMVADPRLNTLVDFRYKRRFEAKRGGHGMGKQRAGKKGDDLLIPVPVGTVVKISGGPPCGFGFPLSARVFSPRP